MNAMRARHCGFTLIECLVTVGIVGVLSGLAAPSFSEYRRNAELTSAANDMAAAINAAKAQGMNSGLNAIVAPVDGSNWSSGWVVFVDKNYNGVMDAGVEKPVYKREPLPATFETTGSGTAAASAPYIIFDALGYARDSSGGYSNSTVEVASTADGGSNYMMTRRIKVAGSGRIRVCKPVSATDPDCSLAGL